tara:strand:+ start:153 stop:380 length:228 start_codon:yes stop_codon:yes gene_type:complete
MKSSDLPLFRLAENREALATLQERRSALLKRLHGLPPHSRLRAGLTYELSLVTAEQLRCEAKAYFCQSKRRGHHG